MKELPILFSAPMVRAILGGRKTQTRRIVKGLRPGLGVVTKCQDGSNAPLPSVCWDIGGPIIKCPYGFPGDRLWVRETWQCSQVPDDGPDQELWFAADSDGRRPPDVEEEWSWRPSIHMPRWASRITLEITSVRVERLQEISEGDAKAEGCAPAWLDVDGERVNHGSAPTYRQGYARLWGEINGPGSWADNPWVWVIEFKRVTP